MKRNNNKNKLEEDNEDEDNNIEYLTPQIISNIENKLKNQRNKINLFYNQLKQFNYF